MEDLKKYFSGLKPAQIAQYEALGPLYEQWNQKINVISRRDIDNFYNNHVLHSLSIAKFVELAPGTKVLDAGTGGGFPGLPLAIMFPDVEFVLVDSTAKKLSVINNVVKEIGLNNLITIHARLEDLDGSYGFVVSRAVSRLDVMWSWVSGLISNTSQNSIKNGLIYLKGGDISGEIPNNTFIQKKDINELFGDSIYEDKSLIYIAPKQR